MKIIWIITICLIIVATIIIIWGALTKWKFICKKKDNYEKNNLACFTGSDSEWGEREVAHRYTRPHATVLEFGGGQGSVSVVIQKKLKNPRDHIVIQPTTTTKWTPFAGLETLIKNKKSCNSKFTIIDHILKPGEGKKLLKMVSKPFDTMIVDCEGCLHKEFEKNPDLFKYVTQIQVERDDREISLTAKGGPYEKLLKNDLGMRLVHTGKGCGGRCATEVWEK